MKTVARLLSYGRRYWPHLASSVVMMAIAGAAQAGMLLLVRQVFDRVIDVYKRQDRLSRHVRMADEAEHIGPSPSAESYLVMEKVLDAARRHGVDAIHPGYGFLSENAEFAAACEDAGLVFVGPSSESIRRMGSKTAARPVSYTHLERHQPA